MTGYGATITWDSATYASDASSVIAWTILPAYYDTATYDYRGRILDAYGNVKKTWTISAASGTESTTLDATTYPPGTYFAVITKTLKASPYTETTMIYDYAEIVTDVIINGGTYNYTGVAVPGAVVNLTQSGATTQHTTTPLYNQTGLDPLLINLTTIYPPGTTKFIPVEFTPPSWGTYTINLYGAPTVANMTYTGNSSIYGFVLSNGVFQPVPGATVIASNATAYTITTTNASGFYQFNGMAKGQYYTLNATATGYNTSSNYNVNSSTVLGGLTYNATRQDIVLTPQYNVRIDLKDATTLTYILSPATITFQSGLSAQSATTTTGMANFTAGYGLYLVAATVDGYYTATTTSVISGDRVITLYLTRQTVVPTPQQWVTTQTVRFMCRDWQGKPLVGMNVSAVGIQTTMGSLDWFSTLFGINLDTTPLINTTMNGTTGDDGSIVFVMIPTEKYRLDYYSATYGINESRYYYPKENEYNEVFWSTPPVYQSQVVNYTFYNMTNGSFMDLGVNYTDISMKTDAFTFFVQDYNHSTIYSWTAPATIGNANKSYPVPININNVYYYGFTANNTAFGNMINETQFFRISGNLEFYPDLFFKYDAAAAEVYNWIAIILILLISYTFSRISLRFGLVSVPVMGLLFKFMGYLQTSWFILSIALTLGIFWYLRYAEEEG